MSPARSQRHEWPASGPSLSPQHVSGAGALAVCSLGHSWPDPSLCWDSQVESPATGCLQTSNRTAANRPGGCDVHDNGQATVPRLTRHDSADSDRKPPWPLGPRPGAVRGLPEADAAHGRAPLMGLTKTPAVRAALARG